MEVLFPLPTIAVFELQDLVNFDWQALDSDKEPAAKDPSLA